MATRPRSWRPPPEPPNDLARGPGRPGRLLHQRTAMLPEVLTACEAAAILRVGRNQLYQAVARGQLGAIRIGRSIRIPRQALLGLLASTGPLTVSSHEQPRQPATQVWVSAYTFTCRSAYGFTCRSV
jgi:excisionase family DNA binding protein